MKLIDERGRLFGILNIIDLLIISIIAAALLGAYYKFGLLNRMEGPQTVQDKTEVTIWVKDVSKYVVDAISEGDMVKEVRSNNEIGKIIKKEVAPYTDKASTSEGKWVVSEVPGKYSVFITMETPGSPDGNLMLGSSEAKVGAQLLVKGPKFKVESYIVEVK